MPKIRKLVYFTLEFILFQILFSILISTFFWWNSTYLLKNFKFFIFVLQITKCLFSTVSKLLKYTKYWLPSTFKIYLLFICIQVQYTYVYRYNIISWFYIISAYICELPILFQIIFIYNVFNNLLICNFYFYYI